MGVWKWHRTLLLCASVLFTFRSLADSGDLESSACPLILVSFYTPQILVDVRKIAKLASQARQSVSLSMDQTVATVVSQTVCL